ncbi:Uncharacterized protein HZ326_31732 [Fusarium oxysporum f. sp. albedinis]|nr:Uncharacterized protein HZ326_31732 [Fusarium oxysporum f. sp. albedinis]
MAILAPDPSSSSSCHPGETRRPGDYDQMAHPTSNPQAFLHERQPRSLNRVAYDQGKLRASAESGSDEEVPLN